MCIRDRSYGGHSEGETPGSIPNPEAKPFSADGTALVTVWESRTPPDIHYERAPTGNNRSGLFHVRRLGATIGHPGYEDHLELSLTSQHVHNDTFRGAATGSHPLQHW